MLNLPQKDINKVAHSDSINHLLANLSLNIIAKLIRNSQDLSTHSQLLPSRLNREERVAYLKEASHSSVILEHISLYNPGFFNQIIKFLMQEKIEIEITLPMVYRMTTENLAIFLALSPDALLPQMEKIRGFSRLTNWRYKDAYLARLQEANSQLEGTLVYISHIDRSLASLPDVLVELCLLYLGIEKDFINRLHYQKQKLLHPTILSDLQQTYKILKSYFPHSSSALYMEDEASIILEYATSSYSLQKRLV